MLEFNVRNQKLSRIDSFEPAEKSVGYLKAKFNFLSDEWKNAESVTLRARNRDDSIVHETKIVNNEAIVPWEALDKVGMFLIALYAEIDGAEITTSAETIGLSGTLDSGENTNPPTPTAFDELEQRVEKLEQSGGGDVDMTGYATEKWVQDGYQPKGKYLTDDTLSDAINDALTQAKESGEFDYVLTDADKQEIADLIPIPGGGGAAIIDVVALPTENIREDVFYRVLTGSFVYNQNVQNGWTCYCVEELPETGEPAFSGDLSDTSTVIVKAYYNVSDGSVMAYVPAELGSMFGVPEGWYPIATLMSAIGYTFSGIITNILDDPNDGAFRLLLECVVYDYKNGNWASHKKIGRAGIVPNAETFNHPSNEASGFNSHAEGYNTTASGHASHAEGHITTASGGDSHAEGNATIASEYTSHAEGYNTRAIGKYSHAEGYVTTASGWQSHAEGFYTRAIGYASHAEGRQTIAASENQHAQGRYNIEDSANTYAHIVGNGTSDSVRSNAHTLDWDGNAWFAGGIELNSPDGTRYRIKVENGGTLKIVAV